LTFASAGQIFLPQVDRNFSRMRLLAFAACLSLVAGQTNKTTIEPKFLDLLNSPPIPTTTTSASTSTTGKATTVKSVLQDELQDALAREEALKQELVATKNAIATKTLQAAPSAAPLVVTVPNGSTQEDSNQLAAKLLGSKGIMSILNPQIMDQQEAATKLIPSLQNNPAVQKFQQQQAAQANQAPQARQMFGSPMQGAFPYQPQLPMQGQGMMSPSFQQQPFGSLGGGQMGGLGGQMGMGGLGGALGGQMGGLGGGQMGGFGAGQMGGAGMLGGGMMG
jgi:hypothetical protein